MMDWLGMFLSYKIIMLKQVGMHARKIEDLDDFADWGVVQCYASFAPGCV